MVHPLLEFYLHVRNLRRRAHPTPPPWGRPPPPSQKKCALWASPSRRNPNGHRQLRRALGTGPWSTMGLSSLRGAAVVRFVGKLEATNFLVLSLDPTRLKQNASREALGTPGNIATIWPPCRNQGGHLLAMLPSFGNVAKR